MSDLLGVTFLILPTLFAFFFCFFNYEEGAKELTIST